MRIFIVVLVAGVSSCRGPRDHLTGSKEECARSIAPVVVEEMLATIARAKAPLAECAAMQRELAPGDSGRLVMAFVITPAGSFVGARQVEGPYEPALVKCLARVLDGLAIKTAPSAETTTCFPFRY